MKTVFPLWLSLISILTMVIGCQVKSKTDDEYHPATPEEQVKRMKQDQEEITRIIASGKVPAKVVGEREEQANQATMEKIRSLDVTHMSHHERSVAIARIVHQADAARKRMRDSFYKEKFSPNW